MSYFVNSLGSLPCLSSGQTLSISAENPKGEKGRGGRAIPDSDSPASQLGRGWKVRPSISLEPGRTVDLAEINHAGVIQHIWMTVDPKAYWSCILRFYWDDEKTPSVEVPLGDFFANGHGQRTPVNSLPVVVNSTGGFNCYWPMPFRKSCRITIENQHWQRIDGFFYQITYTTQAPEQDAAYFHAQWRRGMTRRNNPEFWILDNVQGRGQYVGSYLAWTQLSGGWWGEGEIKFFLDGDEEFPSICGTGIEDYFGGAWCFEDGTYSTPFLGYPLKIQNEGDVPKHGLYRWHIMDPIRFDEDLSVSIQALGWWRNQKFQPLADDIASTAFWYQSEPHGEFPDFPALQERFPR